MLDTFPGFLCAYDEHSTRGHGRSTSQRACRVPSLLRILAEKSRPHIGGTPHAAPRAAGRAPEGYTLHGPLSYLFRNAAAAVDFRFIPSAKGGRLKPQASREGTTPQGWQQKRRHQKKTARLVRKYALLVPTLRGAESREPVPGGKNHKVRIHTVCQLDKNGVHIHTQLDHTINLESGAVPR